MLGSAAVTHSRVLLKRDTMACCDWRRLRDLSEKGVPITLARVSLRKNFPPRLNYTYNQNYPAES